MTIRETQPKDTKRVMQLYEEAKLIMRSDGNMHQWTGGYPTISQLEEDMRLGHSFVVEDNGMLVATFACIIGEDPTYKKIYEGRWIDDTLRYATIHRLASTPDSHGIAKACFDWTKERIGSIRVDTHRDNRIMHHVLQENGFTRCGIIYLLNGDERIAYQWLK